MANSNGERVVKFLDRHGALTVLLAIAIQTAGAIWWASSVNSQLEYQLKSAARRDLAIIEMAKAINKNSIDSARMGAMQLETAKALDRLIDKVK